MTADTLPGTIPADQIVSGALQLFDAGGTILITEQTPDGWIMAALLEESDEDLAAMLPMRRGETAKDLMARLNDDDVKFCKLSATMRAKRNEWFAAIKVEQAEFATWARTSLVNAIAVADLLLEMKQVSPETAERLKSTASVSLEAVEAMDRT